MTIKVVSLFVFVVALTGCSNLGAGQSGEHHAAPVGTYRLFETSQGTVYRVNTSTGSAQIVYSLSKPILLSPDGLYRDPKNETVYKYAGNGQLTKDENATVDALVNKYAKPNQSKDGK